MEYKNYSALLLLCRNIYVRIEHKSKAKKESQFALLKAMGIEDLGRAHRLVSHLLVELEEHVTASNITDPEQYKFLWGERESAVSVLTKLNAMLVKIISIEKEINKEILDTTEDVEDLSNEEAQILEEYVLKKIHEINFSSEAEN